MESAPDQAVADESLTIVTADGLSLEAEVRVPAEPKAAAVVCHPHPLYGGNMANNVVAALFDELSVRGAITCRFNFRGVGRSDGGHDGGRKERLDIEAAVEAMTERLGASNQPLLLAGYSFGADTALTVADAAVSGWLAVAPPLRVVPIDDMAAGPDARPKRLATGVGDEFRGPADARAATAHWTNCTVTDVAGADHFFSVGLDTVRSVAAALLDDLMAAG
jgi:alpha/beta superfamily hydrolase